MRQSQLAGEKQQALTLLIAAQGIASPDDRTRIVRALSSSWPDNQLLAAFARSNGDLVDVRARPTARDRASRCQTITADLRKLSGSISDLNKQVLKEGIGYGKGGIMGNGPVAAALREQKLRFFDQKDSLLADAKRIGCQIES
jgi:hypothetical protein